MQQGLDELRALYRERRLPEALDLYRNLAYDQGVTAEVHLWGARIYRLQGDLMNARRVIDLAKEKVSTGVVLGQILFTRGNILREIGDAFEAVPQLEECIRRFPEYSALGNELLGPAHYNLGLALRQRRRYDDAMAAYRVAADMFRAAGLNTYLAMCLHNLSWVSCLHGDQEEAREALNESYPLSREGSLYWHQLLGQALLDSLAPGEERYLVMDRCAAILERGDEVPAEILSHACWLAGRLALQLGQIEEAQRLAMAAAQFGEVCRGDGRTLHDASELLRDVRRALRGPRDETGS